MIKENENFYLTKQKFSQNLNTLNSNSQNLRTQTENTKMLGLKALSLQTLKMTLPNVTNLPQNQEKNYTFEKLAAISENKNPPPKKAILKMNLVYKTLYIFFRIFPFKDRFPKS